MTLTDLDRAVLDFEGQWWSKRGSKEQAIRDLFGVSVPGTCSASTGCWAGQRHWPTRRSP